VAWAKRIPGFDKVRFAGFSTDFQNAQADLEFFPSDKLKSIFKVFDLPPGEPFKGAITFDLKKGVADSLALVIPHEIKTTG
jgi:hypothetical protein